MIPPYKPDWAARYQALLVSSRDGKVLVDPTARCLPPGMPRTMSTPFPIEFSVEPNRVLMRSRSAASAASRPTAPSIPRRQSESTFMGDTVGHWEGDTLVADTVVCAVTRFSTPQARCTATRCTSSSASGLLARQARRPHDHR